jgi:transposase
MSFVSKREKLKLTKEEEEKLKKIIRSRKEGKMRIERAQMLLYYHEGKTVSAIARLLQTNRPRVERSIDKALQFGVITSLEDLPRKGRTPTIAEEAKTWLLSIACIKPKEIGFASEHGRWEAWRNI